MKFMHRLSIVTVLRSYNGNTFRRDLIAGLTTAVMIIPQGMAYALLAGLPAYVGLYASTVPLIAYALFGTSRTLAVGPTAIDSLLTATVVGTICATNTDRYLEMCALLAILVGGIQGLLGILRAGFIVRLLSIPVIKGFTSAAALIIAINQLKLVLGVSLARSTFFFDIENLSCLNFKLLGNKEPISDEVYDVQMEPLISSNTDGFMILISLIVDESNILYSIAINSSI